MMPAPRLLALDLDGTLVRRDGHVDPRDAAAVREAAAAGVTVTIATGRLGAGALPTARALGLEAPVICADGAVVVCARRGVVLEHTPLPDEALAVAIDVLACRALSVFAFAPFDVHGDASGRAWAARLRGFSPVVHLHDDMEREACGAVVGLLGVGERRAAAEASEALADRFGRALDVVAFPLGDDACWAVRLTPRSASKGAALAKLAAELGIERHRVAAVGDHYNDVSMLAWAAHSFAMGQSPAEVRAAASCTLAASAETGGGVAEAIARCLSTCE